MENREFDSNYYSKERAYKTIDEFDNKTVKKKVETKKSSIKSTMKKIAVLASSLAVMGASTVVINDINVFKEPAIEYAVKDYLNLKQNAKLTDDNLKEIKEFTILGESIYIINGKQGSINIENKTSNLTFTYDGKIYSYGDIASTEDFSKFPNLKKYEVKYNIS